MYTKNAKLLVNYFILILLLPLFLLSCTAANAPVQNENTRYSNVQDIHSSDIAVNASPTSSSDDQISKISNDDSSNAVLNSQKVDIKFFEIKGIYDYTWPSIYQNTIAFANHPKEKQKDQAVYLVDINNNIEKIIYTSRENIDDVKVSGSRIYWIEGDAPEEWRIMTYNIVSEEIVKVKDSKNKNYTLVPRINNYGNKLFWLEGYRDEKQNLRHAIFFYDSDLNKIEQLAEVNYVDNPYQILIPRSNYICFADKVGGNWVIRIIDIKSREETTIDCASMPIRPVCDGNMVVWTEGDLGDNFYLYDVAKKEKEILDHRVNYADIIENCVVYSKGHQLYKYYKVMNKCICLTEQLKNSNRDLTMWFSCYKNNIVIIDPGLEPGNSKLTLVTDNNTY